MQTWPVNFHDAFWAEFCVTETNPDAGTFLPQAAAEFRRAVNELFGADTEGLPLRYCHRWSRNERPV